MPAASPAQSAAVRRVRAVEVARAGGGSHSGRFNTCGPILAMVTT